MDATFDRMQAAYDAAEPDDEELPEPRPTVEELAPIVNLLAAAGMIDHYDEIHRLSDRQATVCVWIDGHEYSLTLNLED